MYLVIVSVKFNAIKPSIPGETKPRSKPRTGSLQQHYISKKKKKNSLVQRRVAFAVAQIELRLDRPVFQPRRLHVGLEVDGLLL